MDFEQFTPRKFKIWLEAGLEHYTSYPERPFDGFSDLLIPHYEHLVPAITKSYFSLSSAAQARFRVGLVDAASHLSPSHPRFLAQFAVYCELAAEVGAERIVETIRSHFFAGTLSNTTSENTMDCATIAIHALDSFIPRMRRANRVLEDLYKQPSLRAQLPTAFFMSLSHIRPDSWPFFYRDWVNALGGHASPDEIALFEVLDNLLDRVGMRAIAHHISRLYEITPAAASHAFLRTLLAHPDSTIVVIRRELLPKHVEVEGTWYLTHRTNFDAENIRLFSPSDVELVPTEGLKDTRLFAQLTWFLGKLDIVNLTALVEEAA